MVALTKIMLRYRYKNKQAETVRRFTDGEENIPLEESEKRIKKRRGKCGFLTMFCFVND